MKIEQEIKLTELIGDSIGKLFEWGKFDCNTLALEWLDVIAEHKKDDLDAYRKYGIEKYGWYSTEEEALKIVESEGDIVDKFLEIAGVEEVPKKFEQKGDFILIPVDDKPWSIAGICDGLGRGLFCLEKQGVRLVPLAAFDEYTVRRAR